MLPREAANIDEHMAVPSSFDFDEVDTDTASEILDDGNERRTWRRVCAAKRSIERMREAQALKEELTDVFDEYDDDADYFDGADVD